MKFDINFSGERWDECTRAVSFRLHSHPPISFFSLSVPPKGYSNGFYEFLIATDMKGNTPRIH